MRAFSLAVLNRSQPQQPPKEGDIRRSDSCFSISLKLSKERLQEVRSIDSTLKDYVTPLKHKDSISRLSEAIERFRGNKY